jgi:hypothetical protein
MERHEGKHESAHIAPSTSSARPSFANTAGVTSCLQLRRHRCRSFRQKKITRLTHRRHVLHTIGWRDFERSVVGLADVPNRRYNKPPEIISPGASSSSKPLTGNCSYDATCLCRLRCFGGDHDRASAPRNTSWRACKLSDALRLLD